MAIERQKLTAAERLKRLKQYTRDNLPETNSVQFRVDRKTLIQLIKAADQKKMPLGTLVRMWTVERLEAEGFSIEK